MQLHSFSLFIKDALKNILLNKVMSLATIVTLAAGIFLFGVTTALAVNVFSITDKLEKDFKLAVYIDEELEKDEINEIGIKIQELTNVESIEFVSKEDAFDDFKEQWGDTDILDGIDDGSILRDSYKITLSDLSKSKDVTSELEKIDGIAKITQLEDEMTTFVGITNKIQIATIIISIILALLSVLIITNTINMSIFSRRKQINIMKYVGATDWYIRWPFIFEGLIIGLLASLVAWGMVYYLYGLFLGSVGSYSELIGILPADKAMPVISFVIISGGILLGCLGSILSVKKHLRV